MELTFSKLIQFDLMKNAQRTLLEGLEKEGEGSVFLREYIEIRQQIQSVDQFIKESPSFPGSTQKIIREELVSAIGATLAIEGTTLKNEEIEESFRKADLQENLARKEQEAENSRKAYNFMMELVDNSKSGGTFLYTERIIRQIHKLFTENMHYPSNEPGRYRLEFSVIFGVPRKSSLCKNRGEVENAMSNLVDWLNRPESGIFGTDAIVKAILAHYFLAEIHPFVDGNGRTARALEALILYVNGINTYCFWSLANFWSTHRDKYLVHLGNIRNTCNPLDFVMWGMKGYLDELKRIKGVVLRKVKQLMLMDYTKYLLANKKNEEIKITERIVNVMRLLVRSKPLSLSKFQSTPGMNALYSNVSLTTRQRDLNKMVQLRLVALRQLDGKLFIESNFNILDSINYRI